jgi:hypothetical protein
MKIEFSKISQIPNLKKIRPVGTELFHAGGHTDMKLIVAFHNFVNALYKSCELY